MNNKDTMLKVVFESIVVISIMAIYITFGVHYLPLLIFLFPVPFVVLGVKNGLSYNIISMALTSLIVGLLVDKMSSIFLFIAFAPLSIVLSYGIKKRRRPLEIMSISTATFLVTLLLMIGLIGDLSGINFVNQLEQSFMQMLNTQLDMLKDMGLTSYEMLKTKDLLENAYNYIILIIPTMLVIFSLVTSYLNYLLSAIGLRKIGYGVVTTPKFSKFKLPNNIIPGIAVMFLGTFLIKKLQLFYYETVFVNIVVLVGFMFFIQGLSVLDFLLIKSKMFPVLRVLLLLFTIVVMPLGWIITLIGFWDAIFDIRKFKKA